jgi:hypothetical protein
MDKVRNEEVRRRCGSELNIGERMDIKELWWYSHMRRIDEDRVVKRV